MPRTQDLTTFLESFAPLEIAEDWDNVGLLFGDATKTVQRIMTCLTLTEDVAAEAIAEQADVVVSHHPILFRAAQRITTETSEGRMLLALARAHVAVYSPHTAFDNAAEGINVQLAKRLGLENVRPLRAAEDPSAGLGAGRLGELPQRDHERFPDFVDEVLAAMKLPGCEVVATDATVGRVAIACGSAAEFLGDAVAAQCDVFITGEARFHAALAAKAQGIGLILLGHYASERFALETLAQRLGEEFRQVKTWASRSERDPLQYVSTHSRHSEG